ncbi:MAG TPA: hypothetical protein VM784_01020 [Actinomycetota bacterium]|nr:hypothetical protein [Actinomycetota bacterium]
MAERAAHHTWVLAARQQLGRVASEVRVTLAQRLAEIDDRFAQLDLALTGDVRTRALLAGRLVELGTRPDRR